MSRYRFIAAEKEAAQAVTRACAVLGVSRSAYYQWDSPRSSPRRRQDALLCERIIHPHPWGQSRYLRCAAGAWAVAARRDCLWQEAGGTVDGAARTGRVPRTRRRKQTTIADPRAQPVATDLVQRAFTPAGTLNRVWVGDITYLRTWEGWCYLATVIDLASRRVVGFAVADHMRASLVCDALTMATATRRPLPGLVFHSDRGSQYTSHAFTEQLTAQGIAQSLSRRHQCWDNAVAESFVATLKTELIYRLP